MIINAKTDFAKLTADLAAALVVARAVAEASDDGGTCNFDAPKLQCDRMPHKAARAQIEAAMASVGLSGFWHKSPFHGAVYVFGPGCGGQANSRSRAAEAMRDELTRRGWDIGVWYQAD